MTAPARPTTRRLPNQPPRPDPVLAISDREEPRLKVRSFGRSASIVAIAFIVSRVLGLGREVVLAHLFGTGGESDAYVSAFRIPDFLFLVAMSGAFGAAFVPIFGGYLARDERDKAWRLASSVITLTGIVSVILAAVMWVFARP